MVNVCLDRKGAMMLLLLVVLIIGSLVALQLVPNEEIVTRRSKETGLNTQISQLREAFDLMMLANPGWQPWPDGYTPTKDEIAVVIKTLDQNGFLRNASSVVDPTVMPHHWYSNDQMFWRPATNLASNSSFQISVDGITAWDWNTTETNAATDTVYLRDMRVDDYPYQNKLGNLLGNSGSTLKITR